MASRVQLKRDDSRPGGGLRTLTALLLILFAAVPPVPAPAQVEPTAANEAAALVLTDAGAGRLGMPNRGW